MNLLELSVGDEVEVSKTLVLVGGPVVAELAELGDDEALAVALGDEVLGNELVDAVGELLSVLLEESDAVEVGPVGWGGVLLPVELSDEELSTVELLSG
jgi:hypothetical protein